MRSVFRSLYHKRTSPPHNDRRAAFASRARCESPAVARRRTGLHSAEPTSRLRTDASHREFRKNTRSTLAQVLTIGNCIRWIGYGNWAPRRPNDTTGLTLRRIRSGAKGEHRHSPLGLRSPASTHRRGVQPANNGNCDPLKQFAKSVRALAQRRSPSRLDPHSCRRGWRFRRRAGGGYVRHLPH
jgi:hypothetical protein